MGEDMETINMIEHIELLVAGVLLNNIVILILIFTKEDRKWFK
jgi:hypothetical protein